MRVEWNFKKSVNNERKHRVSFEEALTIFSDPQSVTYDDPEHSEYEARYITFGMSALRRLLAVIHTERGNSIRLISARLGEHGFGLRDFWTGKCIAWLRGQKF